MSTVLDETKNEGQVMSPVGIVTMILDAVQYTGKSVLTKTIMENIRPKMIQFNTSRMCA